jgi:hypothetical protein
MILISHQDLLILPIADNSSIISFNYGNGIFRSGIWENGVWNNGYRVNSDWFVQDKDYWLIQDVIGIGGLSPQNLQINSSPLKNTFKINQTQWTLTLKSVDDLFG